MALDFMRAATLADDRRGDHDTATDDYGADHQGHGQVVLLRQLVLHMHSRSHPVEKFVAQKTQDQSDDTEGKSRVERLAEGGWTPSAFGLGDELGDEWRHRNIL